MWRASEVQCFSRHNMEWILHQIVIILVIPREEVPPVQIVDLSLITWRHVNLVMQTHVVLNQDEHRGEEDEYSTSLTVNAFVSSVDDKEDHVTQIVEAVKVLHTSLEQVNQDDHMGESTRKEDPDPSQLFCSDSCSEEAN